MPSPNEQAGRIHKQAFMVSTAVLLALCLLSAASRFYVRLQVREGFSIDDGFFVTALCCLICSVVIMYSIVIDKLYLVQALSLKLPNADIPPDYLQQSYDFHKWITISLMLGWCSIMSVKFCFLFLFRKLVDRIRPLVIYWWAVTAFNVVILGYGVSVYYVACPYFGDSKIFECNTPSGIARTMRHAVAQTILDLLGDFLILYIPVKLIWDIQIKRSQKAVLAFSLCLTFFMILVTITRISGIKMGDQVDLAWESFFILIAGEIGIILTAVTAFRTYFVSRHNNKGAKKSPESQNQQYSWSRYLFKLLLTPSLWRSTIKARSASGGGYEANEYGHLPSENLPQIPRAHMTGVRTFIDRRGRGTNNSHLMESKAIQEGEETWRLQKNNHDPVDQV